MATLSVSQVLALSDTKKGSKLPSIEVKRALDQENDLGNLLGTEENDLACDSLNEEELLALARDNVQLLFNAVWQLPTERIEEALVAKLPPGTTKLPREKPLPKPKPLTKWEQYAKEKGIVKKKTKASAKVWDDVVKEWVPKFGYKKAKAEAEKNWMMEYKEGQDVDVDPFEKAIQEKRERVAKNELQRLRNIARTRNTKVPGVGLTTSNDNNDLKKAAELAKVSTASMGKFQDKLPSQLEKKVQVKSGKKRKFDALVGGDEKEKNIKVLESIQRKAPKLNVTKGVGKQIHGEEQERRKSKGNNKKDKKGGKRRGNFSKGKQSKAGGKNNNRGAPKAKMNKGGGGGGGKKGKK